MNAPGATRIPLGVTVLSTYRRPALGAAIALLGVLVSFTPGIADAQDLILDVPLGTVVESLPGVTTVIGSGPTPGDLVGRDCAVEARGENNSSVHPGTDLVVSSGDQAVRLTDVEATPGKVTTAAARLSLAETFSISVVMGPDGIFSGGAAARVVVDCTPLDTTTTATTMTPEPIATAPAPNPPSPNPPTPNPPTVAAQVLAQVQEAPQAQAVPAQPSFTG